jgi:hypothetical protein
MHVNPETKRPPSCSQGQNIQIQQEYIFAYLYPTSSKESDSLEWEAI